jgi:hypothetical protein
VTGKSASQIEGEIREILSGDVGEPASMRHPAASRPMRISATDPATMTAGAINKELDKLDERNSVLTDMMIDAGRGHERPSEYLQMNDPMSSELRSLSGRRSSLRAEISVRYGPGAPSRLPVGGKNRPRKKADE